MKPALTTAILWAVCMFIQSSVVSAAENIGTVTQVYDGTLTSDIQIHTFRNIDRLFPVRVVKHGPQVLALPLASKHLTRVEFSSAGKLYDLIDYMALNRVTALLVLKDGKIAYEDYEMGNTEKTRWMSMSMVKTITASLMGAAIKDGYIKSIDDPVAQYVTKLRGSAYDGVSIRYLLEMASGVKWDETYTNPASDRRHMLQAQIAQRPGAIMDLMVSLPRAAAPGTIWNYSTGETFVAGAVVRSAVGRPLADYLSERIWTKAGMESDATWWLESPDGWVRVAGSSKTIGGKVVDYGYMTWPSAARAGSTNNGAFQAIGIYGQHIYVNPREHVVIVVWGALPKPSGKETIADEDFFAAATEALR
jgi:CubicO group peptidase (beta-lactamase class C family)